MSSERDIELPPPAPGWASHCDSGHMLSESSRGAAVNDGTVMNEVVVDDKGPNAAEDGVKDGEEKEDDLRFKQFLGYHTVVGKRGASLSGGQKQRSVVARNIISNPKVLLLDEATSALDPNAEKIVQQALNKVPKGRTMIIIAHRPSTIRDADSIIVMSKGKTIEQGTHDQVIDFNGAYARFVKAQDIGHASAAEDGEVEDNKAVDDLDGVVTRVSTTAGNAVAAAANDGYMDYSLSRVFSVVKEQRVLWTVMIIAVITCAAAGALYPALAVLFPKTMEAFKTINIDKANFLSVMFFVVACGNLVAYSIAGWTAKMIAQHIMKIYRSQLFDNTLRQDMAFDHPEHGTGALVSRLSAKPTILQDLLSMNLTLLFVNIVNLVSGSILGIAYAWKLGLVLTNP